MRYGLRKQAPDGEKRDEDTLKKLEARIAELERRLELEEGQKKHINQRPFEKEPIQTVIPLAAAGAPSPSVSLSATTALMTPLTAAASASTDIAPSAALISVPRMAPTVPSASGISIPIAIPPLPLAQTAPTASVPLIAQLTHHKIRIRESVIDRISAGLVQFYRWSFAPTDALKLNNNRYGFGLAIHCKSFDDKSHFHGVIEILGVKPKTGGGQVYTIGRFYRFRTPVESFDTATNGALDAIERKRLLEAEYIVGGNSSGATFDYSTRVLSGAPLASIRSSRDIPTSNAPRVIRSSALTKPALTKPAPAAGCEETTTKDMNLLKDEDEKDPGSDDAANESDGDEPPRRKGKSAASSPSPSAGSSKSAKSVAPSSSKLASSASKLASLKSAKSAACASNGSNNKKSSAKSKSGTADNGYEEFMAAIHHQDSKDEKKAASLYRKAAAKGCAEAQYNLGNQYMEGAGVKLDMKEAVVWYQRAAEQKLVHAEYQLARCYEDGTGVARDVVKAVEFYERAGAPYGHCIEAQRRLGECYQFGQLVAQNDRKSFEWYKKAADQGDPKSMVQISLCYHESRGVTKNKVWAQWYRTKANAAFLSQKGEGGTESSDDDEGVPGADEYKRGLAFAYGKPGIGLNTRTAFRLYHESAENGYADGEFALAACYEKGMGVPKNVQKAIEWYRKAAAKNVVDAHYSLGLCYEFGRGVPPDKKEALKCFQAAAALKHLDAENKLGECYEEGIGVEPNFSEAVKWYEMAAEREEADARYNLGALLLKMGDKTKAEKWMSLAAAQKQEDAKAWLEANRPSFSAAAASSSSSSHAGEHVRGGGTKKTSHSKRKADELKAASRVDKRSKVINGHDAAADASSSSAAAASSDLAATSIGPAAAASAIEIEIECPGVKEDLPYPTKKSSGRFTYDRISTSKRPSDAHTRCPIHKDCWVPRSVLEIREGTSEDDIWYLFRVYNGADAGGGWHPQASFHRKRWQNGLDYQRRLRKVAAAASQSSTSESDSVILQQMAVLDGKLESKSDSHKRKAYASIQEDDADSTDILPDATLNKRLKPAMDVTPVSDVKAKDALPISDSKAQNPLPVKTKRGRPAGRPGIGEDQQAKCFSCPKCFTSRPHWRYKDAGDRLRARQSRNTHAQFCRGAKPASDIVPPTVLPMSDETANRNMSDIEDSEDDREEHPIAASEIIQKGVRPPGPSVLGEDRQAQCFFCPKCLVRQRSWRYVIDDDGTDRRLARRARNRHTPLCNGIVGAEKTAPTALAAAPSPSPSVLTRTPSVAGVATVAATSVLTAIASASESSAVASVAPTVAGSALVPAITAIREVASAPVVVAATAIREVASAPVVVAATSLASAPPIVPLPPAGGISSLLSVAELSVGLDRKYSHSEISAWSGAHFASFLDKVGMGKAKPLFCYLAYLLTCFVRDVMIV